MESTGALDVNMEATPRMWGAWEVPETTGPEHLAENQV